MNTKASIVVRQAEKDELTWVNSKYAEVGFVSSNFKNECIVIAEIENQKAGLGRLVKIDNQNIELGGIYVFYDFRKQGVAENIVSYLCKTNPFENATIWCLPFENLEVFYSKFGFVKNRIIPPIAIAKKLAWCNTTYDKKVLLLSK